jgi:uncharacterized membrane protein YdcZ (DUF606 family)
VKKNKVLYISNWLSLVYLTYGTFILVSIFGDEDLGWGAVITTVIAALLIPSLLLVSFGMIIGWFAYLRNKRWLTFTSTILYLLGAIIVFNVGIVLIPNLVLNGTAFVQQSIQFKKDKASSAQLVP